MIERRKPVSALSEEAEDDGLFGKGIVEVSVEVAPLRRRASRGDLVLLGHVGRHEIDVIFPGRRAHAARSLLAWFAERERKGLERATDIRCALRVEGCWRNSIVQPEIGLPERRYQLLVARWEVLETGEVQGAIPRGVSRLV